MYVLNPYVRPKYAVIDQHSTILYIYIYVRMYIIHALCNQQARNATVEASLNSFAPSLPLYLLPCIVYNFILPHRIVCTTATNYAVILCCHEQP